MSNSISNPSRRYRLWIARVGQERPRHWGAAPARATALHLVDDGLYSADEAALFLEGFNGCREPLDPSLWAVAVPVQVCYEGDARSGQVIRGDSFADSPGS